MAILVQGANVSLAWVAAMKQLVQSKEPIPNLILSIQDPTAEDRQVRQALDRLIAEHRSAGARAIFPVETVANTIFPAEYFQSSGDPEARKRGYAKYTGSQGTRKRAHGSRRGTYFGRMIDWPGDINQVEHVIEKLLEARSKRLRYSNNTEIALSSPEDYELRIYDPAKDKVIEGFPCLSHVSISLISGRLHLTSLYRSQEFDTRAYGNLLGLGRLLAFISKETGYPVGELVNVATHAKLRCPTGVGRTRQAQMLVEAEGVLL